MTVVLLTDFDDYYPASMKGVLERHGADYVDAYHGVQRGDVRAGAYVLREYAREFPSGTVHCVVVDPGVGTDRAAVAVESGGQVFVGPDNGVLAPAAREVGDPTWYLLPVEDTDSATFHGRDVFAPAAARIDSGEPASEVGEETTEHVDLRLPEAEVADDEATAEVVYVDGFGNVVTSLSSTELFPVIGYGSEMTVDGVELPFERSYGHVSRGEPLCTVGSHGNLEVAVNHGSASDAFGYSPGDNVHVELTGSS